MKKSNPLLHRMLLFIYALILFLIPSIGQARVYVKGYYRKNGTYVRPHYRSSPDGIPYNNYSYPGNYNPNTGKITTGDPDKYLDRYYKKKTSYSYNYKSSNNYTPKLTHSYSTTKSSYDPERYAISLIQLALKN